MTGFIEVEAPDGSVIEFPENMPESEMLKAMEGFTQPEIGETFNAPAPVETPPAQEPPGFMGRIGGAARGLIDELNASYQGTSPIVRDLQGNLRYQELGTPEISDSGPGYLTPTGEFGQFDASKHVRLRDPKDGQEKIYLRTPENEQDASSLGRIFGFGAIANPVGRLSAGAPDATSKLMGAFERTGVSPSLPALSQGGPYGRMLGRGAQAIRETPFAGAPVERGMARARNEMKSAVGNVANKYGTAATKETAGNAVQSGVAAYKLRFDEKADRLLNRVRVKSESKIDPRETRSILKGVTERFPNAPDLGKELTPTEFKKYASAIEKGDLSWAEMKEFRSAIGRRLREPKLQSDASQSDLKRLYGALSDDMGRLASQQGAKQSWQRYNRFYARGQEHIKNNLNKIFKAESAEKAFNQVMLAAREGGSANLKKLRALRGSLTKDEWGEVSSNIVRNLGNPKAGGVDVHAADFSPSTFITEYSKLTPDARNILFNKSGDPGLRKALDDLVEVVGAQKNVEQLGASSPTYPLTATGGAMAGLYYDPASTIASLMGMYGAGEAMFNPPFVRWMTASNAAAKRGTLPAHVNRLAVMVRQNPRLPEGLNSVVGDMKAAIAGEGEESQQ